MRNKVYEMQRMLCVIKTLCVFLQLLGKVFMPYSVIRSIWLSPEASLSDLFEVKQIWPFLLVYLWPSEWRWPGLQMKLVPGQFPSEPPQMHKKSDTLSDRRDWSPPRSDAAPYLGEERGMKGRPTGKVAKCLRRQMDDLRACGKHLRSSARMT
jgi:hypothetical protein